MSQIEILRVFVNERLTAATEEIFGVVQRIIGEYEDEVSHYKQKLERQRMLLNVFLRPEIRLPRIDDLQHPSVCEVDVPSEHHDQVWSHRGPEIPIKCNVSEFKEEEKEFLMSQEEFGGLQWAEDACNQASSLFPADDNHDQTMSSHIHQSQRDGDGWPLPGVSTDGQMTEDWEVSEPVPSSDGSGAQSDGGEEESSCSPGQKDQGLGTSLRCPLSKGQYESVRQRRRRMRLTRTVTLRISVLLYPHIRALSIPVSRDCPVRKLKVPYGLQEAEFLKLLRSSFPQLADKPFDVLKTDRRRRLCPLNLDKLTPEQIIRSSDIGRSALYIRLKENQEDFRTSAMSVQLQQTKGAINKASEQHSGPSLPRGKPGFQFFRRHTKSGRQCTLRICVLVDPDINALTVPVSRKCPVKTLTVPYGLQEAEFLKLLRSSFPQLADKPFDVLKTDRRRRLCPLNLDKLTPERIVRSSDLGRSALYIRLKVC